MANQYNILDGSDQTVNLADTGTESSTSDTTTEAEEDQTARLDEANSLLRRMVFGLELLTSQSIPDPGR